MRDPYTVLGVSRKASPADIKSAFRKLAKQYHPDVAGNTEAVARTFQEINSAYDILGDAGRRTQFDNGEIDAQGNPVRKAAAPGTARDDKAKPARGEQKSAADAWAERARAGNRKPESEKSHDDFKAFSWARRGPSDEVKAAASETARKAKDMADEVFADLFHGRRNKSEASEEDQETSSRREPRFDDSAAKADDKASAKPEPKETPKPEPEVAKDVEDSHFNLSISFQEAARGTSRRVKLPNGKRLDVKIPAGVRAGQQIRLKGQGQSAGNKAADAIIEITVEPHPNFTTEGDDVYLVLPVTVDEAVLGATVMVPTLDGPVAMKVPAGSNADTTLRLKGRGMPRVDDEAESRYGDQYVTLKVVLPAADDQAFVEAVKNWASTSVYDVRSKIAL